MGGANEKRLPHRPNARGSPPTLLSEARCHLELGLFLALLFGGCAIGLLIPVVAIAVQRSCLSLPTTRTRGLLVVTRRMPRPGASSRRRRWRRPPSMFRRPA
jgi:hypothetical protein